MSTRFKTRKKININIPKIIFIILLIYLTTKIIKITYKYISKPENQTILLETLLINYDHYNNNFIFNTINYASNSFINNPTSIIANSINIEWEKELYYLEDNYIENTNENNFKSEPLVYIYNSHQSEKYTSSHEQENPTVLLAAYNLQKALSNLNINCIVEEQNIVEFMRINNMQYYQSYEASRYFLLDTIEKYPSIKLFIDLHRDAANHDTYTATINEIKYAKIMFVIGKDNQNYRDNYKIANAINNIIIQKYPDLSKGILEKQGVGVNGIYNQDINSNIILIELGSNENTFEEINNTINILSQAIGEYLNE